MVLSIIIALFGSIVFSFLNIPLGEMFGAIIFFIIATKCGLKLPIPKNTLTFIQIILGMRVGTMFSHDLANFHPPFVLFFGLLFCMFLQMSISYLWLYKKEKWSKFNSMLGSAPGAMSAVLAINESHQQPSSNQVIFIHVVRMVSLVIVCGAIASGTSSQTLSFFDGMVSYWIIFIAFFVWLSGLILKKIGVPASYLITGILLSMLMGYYFPNINIEMPPIFVFIATSLMGMVIGFRLKSITYQQLIKNIRIGLTVTLLGLVSTVICALVYSQLTGQKFITMLMAWLPGSVEAVTIVAIHLGIEPVLIVVNHITRMLVIHFLSVLVIFIQKNRKVP